VGGGGLGGAIRLLGKHQNGSFSSWIWTIEFTRNEPAGMTDAPVDDQKVINMINEDRRYFY
jgi:hypothetical protein